tara:strand:+ start:881 stop:1306 length:426 start_codon:yes stop_codon:yes gene_type:complete
MTMMTIYGTRSEMETNANAIYKVTNSQGRKQIYYLFNRVVRTNSKWFDSSKVLRGWNCIIYPEEDNMIDRTIQYVYPEVNLSELEDVWFHPELNVKNYQQMKYEPYIIDNHSYNYDEDEDDDDYDDSSNVSSHDSHHRHCY